MGIMIFDTIFDINNVNPLYNLAITGSKLHTNVLLLLYIHPYILENAYTV